MVLWERSGAFAISVVLYGIALSLKGALPVGNVAVVCAFASSITMAWVAAYSSAVLWLTCRMLRYQLLVHIGFAAVLTYHIVKWHLE